MSWPRQHALTHLITHTDTQDKTMVYLILEDGNRYLKGRRFLPGKDIVKKLKEILDNYEGSANEAGYDRLRNIIDMIENKGGIEYNEMKRLKNWFDTHRNSMSTTEYKLIGGKMMELWVNNKLKSATIAASKLAQAERMKKHLTPSKPKTDVKPKLDPSFDMRKNIMANIKALN